MFMSMKLRPSTVAVKSVPGRAACRHCSAGSEPQNWTGHSTARVIEVIDNPKRNPQHRASSETALVYVCDANRPPDAHGQQKSAPNKRSTNTQKAQPHRLDLLF
jgi:hypothetical protein